MIVFLFLFNMTFIFLLQRIRETLGLKRQFIPKRAKWQWKRTNLYSLNSPPKSG